MKITGHISFKTRKQKNCCFEKLFLTLEVSGHLSMKENKKKHQFLRTCYDYFLFTCTAILMYSTIHTNSTWPLWIYIRVTLKTRLVCIQLFLSLGRKQILFFVLLSSLRSLRIKIYKCSGFSNFCHYWI